jgi:hypothetical protein
MSLTAWKGVGRYVTDEVIRSVAVRSVTDGLGRTGAGRFVTDGRGRFGLSLTTRTGVVWCG